MCLVYQKCVFTISTETIQTLGPNSIHFCLGLRQRVPLGLSCPFASCQQIIENPLPCHSFVVPLDPCNGERPFSSK